MTTNTSTTCTVESGHALASDHRWQDCTVYSGEAGTMYAASLGRESFDAEAERAGALLDGVRPEALVYLLDRVRDLVFSAEFTPLIDDAVTDGGETYRSLRCPHCLALIGESEDELVAVDWSERWSGLHGIIHPEQQNVRFDYSERADYDGGFYQCGHCHRPVALPEGWTEVN